MEANLIKARQGSEIVLCRREELRWDLWAELEARVRRLEYFRRGPGFSGRSLLGHLVLWLWRRWRSG